MTVRPYGSFVLRPGRDPIHLTLDTQRRAPDGTPELCPVVVVDAIAIRDDVGLTVGGPFSMLEHVGGVYVIDLSMDGGCNRRTENGPQLEVAHIPNPLPPTDAVDNWIKTEISGASTRVGGTEIYDIIADRYLSKSAEDPSKNEVLTVQDFRETIGIPLWKTDLSEDIKGYSLEEISQNAYEHYMETWNKVIAPSAPAGWERGCRTWAMLDALLYHLGRGGPVHSIISVDMTAGHGIFALTNTDYGFNLPDRAEAPGEMPKSLSVRSEYTQLHDILALALTELGFDPRHEIVLSVARLRAMSNPDNTPRYNPAWIGKIWTCIEEFMLDTPKVNLKMNVGTGISINNNARIVVEADNHGIVPRLLCDVSGDDLVFAMSDAVDSLTPSFEQRLETDLSFWC